MRSRPLPPAGRRGGFSLVELLVVIGVLALLVALMLPAVQRSREAARDVECRNDLKQVGLAFHMHHDLHRSLPNNGGYDPDQIVLDAAGAPFRPSTLGYDTGNRYLWGVGDPKRVPRGADRVVGLPAAALSGPGERPPPAGLGRVPARTDLPQPPRRRQRVPPRRWTSSGSTTAAGTGGAKRTTRRTATSSSTARS